MQCIFSSSESKELFLHTENSKLQSRNVYSTFIAVIVPYFNNQLLLPYLQNELSLFS